MLDNIGFYTITEERAAQQSDISPMWRCELEITSRCNLRCPYCRGLPTTGDMPLTAALSILSIWGADGMRNVRFSGGEPTLHPNLDEMVYFARRYGARVAVSTNGTQPLSTYDQLLIAGVTDFSVSLDACCSATASIMAGGGHPFDAICTVIEHLSHRTYTTAGVVLTETNEPETADIIRLAISLGVADVRLIPAAQAGPHLAALNLFGPTETRWPILCYRLNGAEADVPVRGLSDNDAQHCWLVRDDSCIAGEYHYPCVIYMRERGKPIGPVHRQMRRERLAWCMSHSPLSDPICRRNCLDVCREFNNAVEARQAVPDG